MNRKRLHRLVHWNAEETTPVTDPDAPPPIEPKPPEYEPGVAPVEEPPPSSPVDPADDRPYGAASDAFRL
ncbi:hypothetical protein EIB18_06340 [Caulobacter vibrioides]|uniref:Uncharacterized protein n=1 Tax=Caulobacter vibrioides (strain ATCC 19089 / CIP 103742 / CB 15) TaxID=190650 RepID=Q9A915_CAUVC|nr:hypothetical protein CC_1179 [Caulobacter vibrioides CB15]ATC24120.1 hypothetical protein CA608_06070 [Caulobacter vibrioides]ATC28004.1 hypothetical protein CA607_06265 [Caulobacter vibrioides]AZH12368.1 hypothetical protein EIB18_06340 [Caulobacter vibrioides]PLR08445.1 hypothetical protein CVUC_17670 [Caulobacter vibrioides]